MLCFEVQNGMSIPIIERALNSIICAQLLECSIYNTYNLFKESQNISSSCAFSLFFFFEI